MSDRNRKRYENLSEDNQCTLFMTIGRLPCIISQKHNAQNGCGIQKSFERCWLCDSEEPVRSSTGDKRDIDCEDLLLTIRTLLDSPQLQKATRLRIVIMRSLKRLLSHTNKASNLDLKTSTFGQWCLRALHSSLRDLRIAAGLVVVNIMKI